MICCPNNLGTSSLQLGPMTSMSPERKGLHSDSLKSAKFSRNRGHRFAPGPIRAVIVGRAKPKPAPGPKVSFALPRDSIMSLAQLTVHLSNNPMGTSLRPRRNVERTDQCIIFEAEMLVILIHLQGHWQRALRGSLIRTARNSRGQRKRLGRTRERSGRMVSCFFNDIMTCVTGSNSWVFL